MTGSLSNRHPSELHFTRILSPTDGVKIAGVAPVFKNVIISDSSKNGIEISGFTNGSYILSNCSIIGSAQHGVLITDNSMGDYLISNCTVYGNLRNGFQLSQTSTYTSNVYVTNCSIFNNFGHGIEMTGYSNLTVSSSSIYNNVNNGLEIHPSFTTNAVGIYVSYSNISSNACGLRFYDSQSTSSELLFNVIVNNSNGAIFCKTVRQCVVQSNTISYNMGYAAAYVLYTDGIFTDNMVHKNAISSCCSFDDIGWIGGTHRCIIFTSSWSGWHERREVAVRLNFSICWLFVCLSEKYQ